MRWPADHRTMPRLLLGLYGLGGLATGWALLTDRAALFMANYLPYHRAAWAIRHGEDLYAVTHPDAPGYHFLYPPVVAPAWLPSTLAAPAVGFAVQTALSIALAVVLAAVAYRLVAAGGVEVGRLDAGLLLWATLGSSVVLPTLYYGNVNLILAGAIAAGVWWLERGRSVAAGIALALPAVVKVFPAALGLWLVHRRDPRAVGAWLATGVGALVAGVVAFGPATTRTWWETDVARSSDVDFAGGLPEGAGIVSVRQPLGVAAGTDGPLVTAAAVVIVAPLVAIPLLGRDDHTGRLLALLAVIGGTLAVLPSTYLYLVFLFPALFPLAYLLRGRRIRMAFLAGMACLAVTLTPVEVRRADGIVPSALVEALAGLLGVTRIPLIGLVLVLVAGAACASRRGLRVRWRHAFEGLRPTGER